MSCTITLDSPVAVQQWLAASPGELLPGMR